MFLSGICNPPAPAPSPPASAHRTRSPKRVLRAKTLELIADVREARAKAGRMEARLARIAVEEAEASGDVVWDLAAERLKLLRVLELVRASEREILSELRVLLSRRSNAIRRAASRRP